ncbi:unnamed protein product [Amaranthus hypochondriacus]
MNITKFTISLTLFLLLPSQLIQAQPSSPGHNDPPYGGNFNPSMAVIIIVLIAALFFMIFFSIYIRHCTEESSSTTNNGVMGRAIGSIRRSRRAQRGLDPNIIQNFPTFDYSAVKSSKIGNDALECAVCLMEFEDNDRLRLIPKCDHVFHPDCIDAWLVGHTTCPVCRCNLTDITVGEPLNDVVVDVNDDVVGVGVGREEDTNNNDSMEEPLHRRMKKSRTTREVNGRSRWIGKMKRSFSTGHVAVKQWENLERFRLRLPDDVRKQIIMSGRLERARTMVVLPRESSSRSGFRTGFSRE